jgi:hypothetical protein
LGEDIVAALLVNRTMLRSLAAFVPVDDAASMAMNLLQKAIFC